MESGPKNYGDPLPARSATVPEHRLCQPANRPPRGVRAFFSIALASYARYSRLRSDLGCWGRCSDPSTCRSAPRGASDAAAGVGGALKLTAWGHQLRRGLGRVRAALGASARCWGQCSGCCQEWGRGSRRQSHHRRRCHHRRGRSAWRRAGRFVGGSGCEPPRAPML